MPRETHEQWEQEAGSEKTYIRQVTITRSFSIKETWNLKIDSVGEPSEEAWQDAATDEATTANDITAALTVVYLQRKFDVELIETEEIDV